MAAGGPEQLVGNNLEAARRRSNTRLAAAHLHLRRISRSAAMRLQQLDSSSDSSRAQAVLQPQRHFWLFGGR